MTEISLVVDARNVAGDLFPGNDIRQFLRDWATLEGMLQGRALSSGTSFPVHVEGGELRIEVIHPPGPVIVDEHARFGVVGVRERPTVREVYRCTECRRDGKRTYGPFICQKCPQDERRVCDLHAIVLPGSLAARCPRHEPHCDGCGLAAAVWCPGPQCRGRVAWCGMHAAAHTSEPSTAYCSACLAELFPPCGVVGGCDRVGSITCDHLSSTGHACNARRCPRHARQWHVFGPHLEGLGRCEDHARLQGLPAEELLYQVLGACSVRRLRPPSLSSLRHMLMKLTARHRPIDDVLNLAVTTPTSAPAVNREISALVARQRPSWAAAAAAQDEALAQRTAELKDWLTRQGNYQAAGSLAGMTWARPRPDRPGKLFVRCDARLLPRAWRDAASAALGFEVRLEKNA